MMNESSRVGPFRGRRDSGRNWRVFLRSLLTLALIGGLLGGVCTAVASGIGDPLDDVGLLSPASVRIQPTTSTQCVDNVFTVDVMIDDATNLGAYEFDLAFDPDVVCVTDVVDGGFLGSTGRSVIPLQPDINCSTGSASFGAFTLGATPPGPNDSGKLATITLRAVSSGTTNLDLDGVQVTDTSGQPDTVSVQDGSVTVLATPSVPSHSSPANASSTCDTTPAFTWSSVSGATSYRIQVDNNSDFSSPETDQTTSNTQYTPSSPLSPGTYYWRVRASNTCGDSNWPSSWSVTVTGPPDVSTLSSPANASTTCDSTPTFTWSSVSGATSYRIQVDNNSDYSSPEIDQTTSNTQYTPSSPLSPGTYYWRVRASNTCGDSNWPSSWSVTVTGPPDVPTLSSPANASTTCDSTPTFTWSSVNGTTHYDIQVDNNSDFSSPEINYSGSSTSHTPSSPLSPGTYYWRVRASNTCGDSNWSSVWNLTIIAAPGAPTLSSPANGSGTPDTTPTFIWSSVSGATSYRVQVDDNSDFSSPEIDQTTPNTQYTPSSPLSTGTYYWRVRASNTCGDSNWSSAWDVFICSGPPQGPSPQSPANASTTCDTTPAFTWSSVSGATSYRVHVDDNSDFSSPEIDQTTSTTQYTPSSPLSTGTYYWRVRVSNACGDSNWSSPWSVTITGPPGVPTLSTPANGSDTSDTTPTFIWSSVSGATSYRIQADNNSDFSSPEIDQTTSDTEYTPSSPLSPGTYYWRVGASNTCGDSNWSSSWSVTVTGPPGVPTLSSPASGSTTCDTTPTLVWSWVNGTTHYDIQVDNNSDFSSPEIDQTTPATSHTPSSPLSSDTYYWRVRACNSYDCSDWTNPWDVTIILSPGPPAPSSPANGSNTCDATPTFTWSSVAGATSYRIQMDNNSDFSSPEINYSGSSTPHTPSLPLSPGTYYWRVRASNTCGDSNWSSVWSLTIIAAPGAPTLSSPANGSGTPDTTPTFIWLSVSGATSYRIQVDDNSDFGSPEIDQTTPNTRYTPSSPLSTGTYYWRVRASNTCRDSNWSSAWDVFICSGPPQGPSPQSPANAFTTCDTTPAFTWSSVSGATSYRIQVDNNSDFSSPEIDQTTSNSQYTPSAPLSAGTYYWRVGASNTCGDSNWSSPWSLTVVGVPDAPTLSSPADKSSTANHRPSFSWSAVVGASSYQIQADNNQDFGSPEIDEASPAPSYTPSSDLDFGTYRWRVRTCNSCGCSNWSADWSVTILPVGGVPSLVSPANGSTVYDTTPTFTWSLVTGAIYYEVEVDREEDFSSPEIDDITPGPSYTPLSPLSPDAYYWRVRACNAYGCSNRSEAWKVTIPRSVFMPLTLVWSR